MKKTERNIAATFARNLKFFRQKCNYSQEKLAELIDVSPATISNYETGEMWPSRQNLANLVEVLKVHPYQLFIDFSKDLDFLKLDIIERVLPLMHRKKVFLHLQKELENKKSTRN